MHVDCNQFIRVHPYVPSSVACLVPFLQGSPLRRQLGQQRRRLPMHGPELVPVFENTVVNRPQANGIGIEQGTAPIARKAVARAPHDVDIAGAGRNTFVEYANALVDEGVYASLDDLAGAVNALRDTEPPRGVLENSDGVGIVVPRTIARQVLV